MKGGILILIIIIFVAAAGFFLFNSVDFFNKSDNVNLEVPAPGFEDVEEMIVGDSESEESSCTKIFSPTYSDDLYYTGPLFDAHFHIPNLVEPSFIGDHDFGENLIKSSDPALMDKILCNFEKENVKGVIGFVDGDEVILEEIIDSAKSVNEKSSGKINLFLSPPGFRTETLDLIQQNNPGLFKGFGEMAFYHPSYANTPPDSSEIKKIYEVSEKHDLIIMMHPDGRQETEVENAVKNNPGVKFLIHGPETEDYITTLMDKYPNVYYSLDAILIRLNYPGALLYTVGSKEEFKSKFGQNYDKMMNDAVKRWKPRIEQHPDRFMWGTDRADSWTYDEEVSILLEEFSRDFIDKLDPSVREKYAYQNAEIILDL